MEEDLEEIDQRKNKIRKQVLNWLKDPLNISLMGVLILAFALRLYYSILVGNQPLWWDEACYGSLAKNLISHVWSQSDLILHESIIRPPLFPLFWAILIFIGIPEGGVRFILELLPSVLSIFFVYLITKEIFDKKAAVISAFIFSVLWIHLFYTLRLLTEVPALLFLFSSIYYFIKANSFQLNYKYLSISLFLLSISTLIRYPNGVIFSVYFLLLLLSKNLSLNKIKFWGSTAIGLIPLIVFFISNFITYRNIFPAFFGSNYVAPEEIVSNLPFAWNLISYIPVYLKTVLFVFFIVGIITLFFEILIGYNLIKGNIKIRNYLLMILILVAIFSFFIFYMRAGDDRWLFVISLPLCCLTGFGINLFYTFARKYNKYLAIILVLVILFIGAYSQITFADNLIKNKRESFLQIRQGFEWIKQNSPEESIIIGSSIQPYAVFYAERQYLNFPLNNSDKDKISQADYLIQHAFTPQSPYINEYLSQNQDKWTPVNIFFFDQEQTQPALVIYKKI